ncbi:CheR family methyltransferase [Pseudomaricurvus sp.]|uniref:CheR family methyltransferase n=1 Tax=Pseudomaricurvus sp. TaxID=2004510 RepID=UPI003F6AA947
MNSSEFESFRLFLQEACGIHLAENKQYLVTTRIRKILQDNQLESLSALVDQLRRSRHSKLREQVVDAMTTNETFWFRDTHPYDYLQTTLLAEIQKKPDSGPIRIWSAACSSGQEPYSISMTVEESRRQNRLSSARSVEIVATDLSASMLKQAQAAEYDKMSVLRGLSPERRDAYFDQVSEEVWRVKPAIRSRVQFRSLNLLDSYGGLGRFDVIFCRNVLIYFTGELKQNILTRLHAALKPGGVLVLGSSEGLAGASELFEMIHCKPGIMYRAL